VDKLTWYIGRCAHNVVFDVRDKIASTYHWPSFVLAGLRATVPRETYFKPTIEQYSVLGNYVFFAPLHMSFAWNTFFAMPVTMLIWSQDLAWPIYGSG
jgi:hypothetical protein